jgi:hypothetical protein
MSQFGAAAAESCASRGVVALEPDEIKGRTDDERHR